MGSAAATPGGCERWDGKAQALPAFGSSRLSPWSLRQYGGKRKKSNDGRDARARRRRPQLQRRPKKTGAREKRRRLGQKAAGQGRKKAEERQSKTSRRRGGLSACRPARRSALAAQGRALEKESPRGAAPAFQGGGRRQAQRLDWIESSRLSLGRGDASDVKLRDFLLIQVVELRVTLARREL